MLETSRDMSSAPPTPQVLSWQTDDGTRMVADCYSASPGAACLLLHGFWRGRRHPRIRQIALELARSGRTVFVPDLRGHGDSGGRFTFNRLEWNDLGGLDLPSDLVTVGLSMGASIAVAAAARGVISPSRLLLISPAADYREIGPDLLEMVRGGHVEREQRNWRPRIDLRSLLTSVGRAEAALEISRLSCPVHLVHGQGDWLVHHRHSEMLARTCPQAVLQMLDVETGRRMHADRLVDHAWPIFGPLLRHFSAPG